MKIYENLNQIYIKTGTNNNYLIIVHDMFVSIEIKRLFNGWTKNKH